MNPRIVYALQAQLKKVKAENTKLKALLAAKGGSK